GSSIGAFITYGKTAAAAALKPLLVTDNGDGTGTLVVSASSSALPTGAATEQGLDDILAKLSADPATQTTLAAILAKLIAAPATEAKQDTGNASLSSIDVKLPAKGGSVPVSGQKTVTTAGTAVAVGGDVDSRDLVVIADPDNSGDIYVGDSSVDAATGVKLPPGGILPCGNVNLAEIYIDADNDGEGISYYYTT
ncbi:hypothetical protein M0R72_20670, partial [Candidatus Pacearchaeota archaeon]|nr:hypothetical protein [Candidatus Pacearchaeota archaeon]